MAERMKNTTSFMYTRNVTDKYMVKEQCHDSLSRVIGNSQARFLEVGLFHSQNYFRIMGNCPKGADSCKARTGRFASASDFRINCRHDE